MQRYEENAKRLANPAIYQKKNDRNIITPLIYFRSQTLSMEAFLKKYRIGIIIYFVWIVIHFILLSAANHRELHLSCLDDFWPFTGYGCGWKESYDSSEFWAYILIPLVIFIGVIFWDKTDKKHTT